jgi:hypothetical protein
MPYRQLQGFTHTLHGLVPALPPGDYSGLRKRILRLDLSPYRHLQESDEPVAISLDSTGVKVHKAGGWVERVHGKKSRYVKLHFAVNTETARAKIAGYDPKVNPILTSLKADIETRIYASDNIARYLMVRTISDR